MSSAMTDHSSDQAAAAAPLIQLIEDDIEIIV